MVDTDMTVKARAYREWLDRARCGGGEIICGYASNVYWVSCSVRRRRRLLSCGRIIFRWTSNALVAPAVYLANAPISGKVLCTDPGGGHAGGLGERTPRSGKFVLY